EPAVRGKQSSLLDRTARNEGQSACEQLCHLRLTQTQGKGEREMGERIRRDGNRAAQFHAVGVMLEGEPQVAYRKIQLVRRERRQLGAAEAEEQLGGLVIHRLIPLRVERALEVAERLLGGVRRERGLAGKRGVAHELLSPEHGLGLPEVMSQLGCVRLDL